MFLLVIFAPFGVVVKRPRHPPHTKSGYKKKSVVSDAQIADAAVAGVFYEGQLWDACSLVQCCHCASVASSQFQFPMKDVA